MNKKIKLVVGVQKEYEYERAEVKETINLTDISQKKRGKEKKDTLINISFDREDIKNFSEIKAEEILFYFQKIEALDQKFFCYDRVRGVMEKILCIALQLAEKYDIYIIKFFTCTQISSDFKFANIKQNHNIAVFQPLKNMDEGLQREYEHLQKEYEHLKKIAELPQELFLTVRTQGLVQEIIGVVFRLAEKSDINVIEFFTRTQAEKILGFAVQVAKQFDIDVIQFITKEQANQIILQPADSKNVRLNDDFNPNYSEELVLPEPMNQGEKGRYEKWADRKNKDEKPLDFLERVWGGHIRAGLLYQTDMRGEQHGDKESRKRGLDKTLFVMVSAQCKEQGIELKSILPSKTVEVERRIDFIESVLKEKSRKKTGYYKPKYAA